MSQKETSRSVTTRVFRLPKGGHAADEYEDAFAVSEVSILPMRAAVADGATESAFAGRWARQLAEGFVQKEPITPPAFAHHLVAWQRGWSRTIAGRAERLPWYAEAKVREGAFATVLGLVLRADATWHGLAVGDSCLFHLHKGDEILRWPLDAPDRFNHQPDLVPSQPGQSMPDPQRHAGHWEPGDAFLLATDAMAAWLMRAGPAAALAFDETGFERVVREARAEGTLRNDDVTLLVLQT